MTSKRERGKEGIKVHKQIIAEKQDLTYLNWTKIRNSSGTAGSFLKAYYEIGGQKVYYKLSNFDAYSGIIGHECINELIADRLLTLLGVEHLSYQLIYADILIDGIAYTTWLCASEDYKQKGESKIALDVYYQAERFDEKEKPLDFCIRQGWGDSVYRMIIVDFLILNRDRHGANIEVLRNSRNKTVRLAPLFDHGLSFVYSCYESDKLAEFDVMEDRPVQCFLGSRSVRENLKIIPKDKIPALNALKEQDREYLFQGLEKALPDEYQAVIWKMIWARWRFYEDFCNQRRRS